ncbi:sigma 54-interacting transcriptional regulator [Amylibacter sp.]|nr:sigma-54-dependent Fis family transcriptional regulator [Amylibacter sp.]MDA9288266.1 sigma 54-interacting transcriptional regulator [Amylibacter sp.]MDA9310821.1 sigma 54-interacting transcriptional regulator [Amylibacter sp.]MDB2559983.1 sigma 54-interacting transcriptional regulator [Amylibacter sp.]MDB2707991.1 sigma 54-interacting transcriptional regulator [Amylibacter sp.]
MNNNATLAKKGEIASATLLNDSTTDVSAIENSWARCREVGLAPSGKPIDAVTSDIDLSIIQEKNQKIRQFVLPELQLLYNQIAGTNFMVAYADTSGVVLDAYLDEEFKRSDAGKAVIPGSIWTEDNRGTNALGLCLFSGKSQIVAGKDHYFRKLGNLSCFAAPIYGQNDEILGVIDATSDAASRQQHTLALVKLASKNVENRLFIEQFSDSLILVFHARHEYLSTTSAALLAVDEHGFIDGANINAKIMLNGLNLYNKQHFGDIFSVPFSAIINRLNSGEIIRIQDAMGSAVFMSMKENTAKKIVSLLTKPSFNKSVEIQKPPNINKKPTKPNFIAEDPILKRHLLSAENALTHGLPVFIEGKRGSGKRSTMSELSRRFLNNKTCLEIDCNQITSENYESILFGSSGKIGYFESETQSHPMGKLNLASGRLISFLNIEELPQIVQNEIAQVIEVHQETDTRNKFEPINGFLFSSKSSMQDLQVNANISDAFLECLIGAQVQLPMLEDRTDFDKIVTELLRQLSPSHSLSKAAMDSLKVRPWPGNIRQLKKVLRVLIANAEGQVIRNAIIQTDQNLSGSEIMPCECCSQSSVRKESCLLVKKTWLETGKNVSLVARRLGLSRTTVYKHIKNM